MRTAILIPTVLLFVDVSAGARDKDADEPIGRDEIVVRDVTPETLQAVWFKLQLCDEEKAKAIRRVKVEYLFNRRARFGLTHTKDAMRSDEIDPHFREPSEAAYWLVRPATLAERIREYKARHGKDPDESKRSQLKRESKQALRNFTRGRLRRRNAFENDLKLYKEAIAKIEQLESQPIFSFAVDDDLPTFDQDFRHDPENLQIRQLPKVKVIEILDERKMVCNFVEAPAPTDFLMMDVSTKGVAEGQEVALGTRLFQVVVASHTYPSGNSKSFHAFQDLHIRDQYDEILQGARSVTNWQAFEDWIIRHTTMR